MTKHISSQFLPLRNLDLLVNTSDDPSLYWINKDELARQNVESAPIFLGIMNERYHYAINVSENSFSDTNIGLSISVHADKCSKLKMPVSPHMPEFRHIGTNDTVIAQHAARKH